MVTVFKARKILTMDHNNPVATHVAVRDGYIVGVGGPDCGDGWGHVTQNDRFADKVIMPGLIHQQHMPLNHLMIVVLKNSY